MSDSWPPEPGDRFSFKPAGGFIHWHEVTRVLPGGDIVTYESRCLARRDCGR